MLSNYNALNNELIKTKNVLSIFLAQINQKNYLI